MTTCRTMQRRQHRHALLVCLMAICACPSARLFAADDAASQPLEQLIDDVWQFDLAESPLLATFVGEHQYNDRLDRVSIEDHRRRLAARREFHGRLDAIDRDALSRPGQINYDILGRQLQDDIREGEFETYLLPITNRSGFHISFPELRQQMPFRSVSDYENYIGRLEDFGRYTDEHIAVMREGISRGVVLPAVVLEGFRDSIDAHIVEDAEQSLLFSPLRNFPERMETAHREPLVSRAKDAIKKVVVPSYQKFLDFMQHEYVPACRGSIAASTLPRGRDYYRFRVRHFTTLDVTPEQVHEIGLSEVRRIRAEMENVVRETGFEGDFAGFLAQLRTDPKFYAETPDQLLAATALVCKRMDGRLPELFKTLPRTPYGIREIPAYIAPKTTTAYYQQPAGDGSRAGFYYVNTYNLKSRPLYGIEALSLHEAVPGHHLQIALQQELTGLPAFRRFAGITVFVEGWALYAERLGLEVGFYEDPYSDFGRLTYEMWRACRLVVDTGMHYFGWTRRQAIEFMSQNTALSLHNITAEVDRYISWPGQALAYKMGELKIRELRTRAEAALGADFDVRDFHDVVLGSGAVPLDVLQENVELYLQAAAKPPRQ